MKKNWLLTLYSNLKTKQKGEDDKISTIFTPKQIIEYCYGITKYLALSPLSESPSELNDRLRSLWEETGFRANNIEHGADQGNITSGYYEDDNYLEYFVVDISNLIQGNFSLLSSDGLDYLCSCDFSGGGFFTDSWGDYDVMPMNDFYIEPTSSSVSGEDCEMIVNYVKNHFVILAPKTLNQINMEFMKFGFVDESGSYSIYNEQVISISNSISGKMFFGEFSCNLEPLSFWVVSDDVIVGYDKTIPIPSESSSDPDEEEINEQQEPGAEPIEEPTEPTPIEIVNGRIFYVQIQASLYLLKLMRGDFSDFDALDDIKIQLPEEQADILVNFRKYIN